MPTPDPLAVLATGLFDPATPDGFHPALRGEQGAALMEWLRDGGTIAPMAEDCRGQFRSYARDHATALGWQGLRSELATLAIMRGYDNSARFYSFLQLALVHVVDERSFEALLAYLNWLAQALTLREVSGATRSEQAS